MHQILQQNHFRMAQRPIIFGMVHLRALPGTPMNKMPFWKIREVAQEEARVLFQSGVDGIIVSSLKTPDLIFGVLESSEFANSLKLKIWPIYHIKDQKSGVPKPWP